MKHLFYIAWIAWIVSLSYTFSWASDTLFVKSWSKKADTIVNAAMQKEQTIEIRFLHQKISADSSAILQVPIRLAGNLILIEAELNHQKGFFILDSGAPTLKLNSVHHTYGSRVTNSDAGGITGRVAQVRLQSINQFQWQVYHLKNTSVESFDMSHIESTKGVKILGLIGYELLKDFEICLDFAKSELKLYKLDDNGNKLANKAMDVAPTKLFSFELHKHIPVIKGKIGKFTLLFGLDTGAEVCILDKNINSKILEYVIITRRAMLNGNGQSKIEVLAGKLNELEIGGVKYKNMRTIITNMSNMNKAFELKLNGMLGFDFFAQRKTAINFKKKQLLIWE